MEMLTYSVSQWVRQFVSIYITSVFEGLPRVIKGWYRIKVMSVKVKMRENKCIAIQVEYLDFDKNFFSWKVLCGFIWYETYSIKLHADTRFLSKIMIKLW